MESPNKKSPSVWFNELRGLLTLIFQKVSKLVDRVLFDKKGSVIISLVLSIMICVVVNYEDISQRYEYLHRPPFGRPVGRNVPTALRDSYCGFRGGGNCRCRPAKNF